MQQLCTLGLLARENVLLSFVQYSKKNYLILPFHQVIDCRTVHVSGDWDLGGRGNEGSLFGYMNVQQYVKQPDGKWLLELDDWTVEPTEFLY